MASFMDSVKEFFTTSKNAVVRTFSRAKKSTGYKFNEMDVRARRRDAISELGEKAYSLAQTDIALPEELMTLIGEIRAMDEGLENARKEHEEWKKNTAEQAEAEKAQLEEQRRIRAEEMAKKRAEAAAQAEQKRAERETLMAEKREAALRRAEEQKRAREAAKNGYTDYQQNTEPQQNFAGEYPQEGRSVAEQAALERAAAMKAAAEAAAAAEEAMMNSAKRPADSEEM